jgi:hypothetical protein
MIPTTPDPKNIQEMDADTFAAYHANVLFGFHGRDSVSLEEERDAAYKENLRRLKGFEAWKGGKMSKVMKDLIEAVKGPIMRHHPDVAYMVGVVESLSAAEAEMKTGGWRKWPEEKPDEAGEYLAIMVNDDGIRQVVSYYFGPTKPEWCSVFDITHWQSLPDFPPLPETKEEE